MDPEYEVIVLFISTTKWSIKVISIDRRTPAEYEHYSLHYANYKFTVHLSHSESTLRVNWSLRFESVGVCASRYARQRVYMGEWAISTRNKIQLARYQLARENQRLSCIVLITLTKYHHKCTRCV